MPLGSSSAAPVMKPGPSCLSSGTCERSSSIDSLVLPTSFIARKNKRRALRFSYYIVTFVIGVPRHAIAPLEGRLVALLLPGAEDGRRIEGGADQKRLIPGREQDRQGHRAGDRPVHPAPAFAKHDRCKSPATRLPMLLSTRCRGARRSRAAQRRRPDP